MSGGGVATLETPRLLLRPLALAGLDRLTTIWTDPAVARLLLTRPSSRAEVEGRVLEKVGMREERRIVVNGADVALYAIAQWPLVPGP